MAKRGRAVRRAATSVGYSSPDPRAVSAPYANSRKMEKACAPRRPLRKKRIGMHKPLENIRESAELSKLGNVSSGCTREKNKNVTLDTEEESKCDNGSSESFQDISNTEPGCATSMEKSETSGSSLPSGVSAVVTDWEYSTPQSLLTTLSSPEILRRSHSTERSQLRHDLMCDDYYTAKKNSTLLDSSKARDLDSVPDLENVSCVFSFPKTYEKRCAKSSKTLQPKDPFVQQHLSTTVSGKKVYKMQQKHPPKRYFTSPAELERQKTEHDVLIQQKQGLLLTSTPFTYPKDLVVELSPIHPLDNDVELQPNSSGVFVHSSQIAPGFTLGDLKDMQKQTVHSHLNIASSVKTLKPSSRGLFQHKQANLINSFNQFGSSAKKQLKPKKKDICCIVTAPQCPNHLGIQRVTCGKHKLPTRKVEKDFLLDL